MEPDYIHFFVFVLKCNRYIFVYVIVLNWNRFHFMKMESYSNVIDYGIYTSLQNNTQIINIQFSRQKSLADISSAACHSISIAYSICMYTLYMYTYVKSQIIHHISIEYVKSQIIHHDKTLI